MRCLIVILIFIYPWRVCSLSKFKSNVYYSQSRAEILPSLIKLQLHKHLFACLFVSLGNLARQRPVWENNPWGGFQDWKAKKAVDGRYNDRSAAGGECVISDNSRKTATWRVDLGDVVSISHIDIYYRTDNLQSTTHLNCRYINNCHDQC